MHRVGCVNDGSGHPVRSGNSSKSVDPALVKDNVLRVESMLSA